MRIAVTPVTVGPFEKRSQKIRKFSVSENNCDSDLSVSLRSTAPLPREPIVQAFSQVDKHEICTDLKCGLPVVQRPPVSTILSNFLAGLQIKNHIKPGVRIAAVPTAADCLSCNKPCAINTGFFFLLYTDRRGRRSLQYYLISSQDNGLKIR